MRKKQQKRPSRVLARVLADDLRDLVQAQGPLQDCDCTVKTIETTNVNGQTDLTNTGGDGDDP